MFLREISRRNERERAGRYGNNDRFLPRRSVENAARGRAARHAADEPFDPESIRGASKSFQADKSHAFFCRFLFPRIGFDSIFHLKGMHYVHASNAGRATPATWHARREGAAR
jgi:hypothetical protein